MSSIILCDGCAEREADFLIGNTRTGDQTAACVSCAPVAFRTLADGIEQQLDVLRGGAEDQEDGEASEAGPAETPESQPPEVTPQETEAPGADDKGKAAPEQRAAKHAS